MTTGAIPADHANQRFQWDSKSVMFLAANIGGDYFSVEGHEALGVKLHFRAYEDRPEIEVFDSRTAGSRDGCKKREPGRRTYTFSGTTNGLR